MREGICKPKKDIPKCIYIAISDSYDRKNLQSCMKQLIKNNA